MTQINALASGKAFDIYKQAKHLLFREQWLQAIDLFNQIYCLQWDIPWNIQSPKLSESSSDQPIVTGIHKLDHDIEQLEFLVQRQLIDSSHQYMIDNLKEVKTELAKYPKKFLMYQLPSILQEKIQSFYDKNIFYEEASPVTQALNPNLDLATIQAQFFNAKPGLVYFDQFLTQEALQKLYRFCLISTIWHDYQKGGGYMGAYMHTGFNCQLLYQVAFELREAFPDVFKNLPLTQMWAYKYDNKRKGIETHADAAVVNVNFWITPDESNLSPTSGGLGVYDWEAPKEWNFYNYNISTSKIHQFLRKANAQKQVIPYRCNRAVMFNSNLFHETDHFQFKDGYQNRRINITMLFGYR